MSKADEAVEHILRRIQSDPRLAYFFDPITKSFELLTEAYAEKHGKDLKEVREQISANMEYEAWPNNQ